MTNPFTDPFWDRPYVIVRSMEKISVNISSLGMNDTSKIIERKYLKKIAKIDFVVSPESKLTWSECGMNAVVEWMRYQNIYENRVGILDLQIIYEKGYKGSIWVQCFSL